MIRLNKVSLHLGKTDRSSSVQFQLAAFEVGKGEMIALTGPSGCGKSTLLNIVSGLRGADKGEVAVAGVDLMTLSPAQLDRHRGTHCGMIFQTFHLLAPFTALENVSIGLRFGARNHANPKKGPSKFSIEWDWVTDLMLDRPSFQSGKDNALLSLVQLQVMPAFY